MLPQRRSCAEARNCLYVRMYPLLACALNCICSHILLVLLKMFLLMVQFREDARKIVYINPFDKQNCIFILYRIFFANSVQVYLCKRKQAQSMYSNSNVIHEQVEHSQNNRQLKLVSVLNCVCADVGLPAVSEQLMGVKEVRSMVQLTLCILAEPYSK